MSWCGRCFCRLFGLIFLLCSSPVLSATLTIRNDTRSDILNILATSPGHEDFFRLDLEPDGSTKVENPGVEATLRIDTGLDLYHFPIVNLSTAKTITFMPGPSLAITTASAETVVIKGSIYPLIPKPGDSPVCNLGTFHPDMLMKDVCKALPGEMPKDDNGAMLTGMGFAGLVWAARLVPEQMATTDFTGASRLEHMELRRPLALTDLDKVLDYFFAHGYAPWQAELPGIELEFNDQANLPAQQSILRNTLQRFMETADHSSHREAKCAQASVIFAPRALLPILEAADDPNKDVEIFTLILRPCADTLIVDVAAYRAQR